MPPAPVPSNEAARLLALREARILDTPGEPQYDNIVELARAIIPAPIALISLVDADRQWFKARSGLDVCQTSRDEALCAHAVHLGAPILTLNALEDPRFCDNPLVLGEPRIRFYAACPVIVPNTDLCLGTVSVFDTKVWHDFPADSMRALGLLAKQVAELIHLNLKLSTERQTLYKFVSKVSHELRTPLNGILGLTLVAKEKVPEDEDLREMMDSISLSADHCLQTVNSIMDFAALQSGTISLEQRPFSLRECIENALSATMQEPNAAALQFSYELAEDLELTGDQRRLERILINLLQNATRFSTEGCIRVVAWHEKSSREGSTKKVHLMVSDMGIGIPSSKAHTLFRPFSQVDDSNTREYGGSGLGLAVCKGLCEAMGGSIWLDSVVGHGSTFFFHIHAPARVVPPSQLLLKKRVLVFDAEEAEDSVLVKHCKSLGLQVSHSSTLAEYGALLHPKAAPFDAVLCVADSLELHWAPPSKTPWGLVGDPGKLPFRAWTTPSQPAFTLPLPVMQLQLKRELEALFEGKARSRTHRPKVGEGLTACVVDDNRINRIVLAEFLKRMGCVPDAFVDGSEVVAATQHEEYDVIFMDVEMPVMDGLQATEMIRRDNDTVHIVGITANASSGLREKCLQAGMDDFMEKPVRFEMIEMILQAIRRRKHGQPRVCSLPIHVAPSDTPPDTPISLPLSPVHFLPSPPREPHASTNRPFGWVPSNSRQAFDPFPATPPLGEEAGCSSAPTQPDPLSRRFKFLPNVFSRGSRHNSK
eukprot:EG_transcript_1230